MSKKTICIATATHNEVESLPVLVEKITTIFNAELSAYDYKIIIADNKSTDGTREWIIKQAKTNKRIQAIFNSTNIHEGSGLNLMKQVSGDAVIMMAADLQDPPELIPQFVRAWEQGFKIVIGVKTKSKENPLVYALRGLYYKVLNKLSSVPLINQFTGFGLYDKAWMKFAQQIDDPAIYWRGVVAKYGFERKEIEFVQPKRQYGESKSNFFHLYTVAMNGMTGFTDLPLRLATLFGFFCSLGSFIGAIVYLVLKLTYWSHYPAGIAPMLIATLLLGSVILFFIGLLGEYIININKRVMRYPHVLEERRINFDESLNEFSDTKVNPVKVKSQPVSEQSES